MTEALPLTDLRAEAYVKVLDERQRGPIAFVAVTPTERLEGINGALGIAVANERGYTPVPLGWARYGTYEAAADHADHLNALIGLDRMEALKIIASTMFGMRYAAKAKGEAL